MKKKCDYSRERRKFFSTKLILIMRLTLFLMLVGIFGVSAKSWSQQTDLKLDYKSTTIKQILNCIEDQSNYNFVYNNNDFNVEKKVDITINNASIQEILDRLLEETGMGYKIMDHIIIISSKEVNNFSKIEDQAKKTVTGKVTDSFGSPLPGVTLVVKGTTQGTITDSEGNYNFAKIPGDAILVFSFVGMKTQEISAAGKASINVTMEEKTVGLEEVVAIGYGTVKKRDMIGSVASITAKDLLKTAPVSIESALQGMAAGVQVNSGAGIPGAPQQIKVRGISSISSGTDPLWIIDGIPVQSTTMDDSYNGETNQSILSMYNPNDVESIEVLKDAAATSIYGSRGSNGVILVTTKSGKKGALKVNAAIKTGFSNWEKKNIGYANSKDYISIMDLAYQNSGDQDYDIPNAISSLDGATETMTREEALATNTNWADEISRTGSFYEADFSASKGTDDGNSYLSLKYRKDQGNLKFNNLETVSANTNLNYKLLGCFDLGYRLFASYSDNDRINSGDGKNGAGGWGQINSNSLPWMKVYDSKGLNGYWNSRAYVNALAGINPINSQSNLTTMNILSSLRAVLHLPVKGLTLKGEYGLNYVANKARSWRSEALLLDGAVALESKYETKIKNYNAYLNYDVPINKDHVLNLVAGVENTRQNRHYMDMRGDGLVGSYPEVGTPTTLTGSTGIDEESYLRGYFGRVNYKMFNKYLIGMSARRDGISKFTSDNRWANFFSGSLGWMISEEKFFHVTPISLLKLRGSYG